MLNFNFCGLINAGLAAKNEPEAHRHFSRALDLARAAACSTLKEAHTLHCLGLMRYRKGHFASAQHLLERSITAYKKQLGPNCAEIPLVLRHLAHVYTALGQYECARSNYRWADGIESGDSFLRITIWRGLCREEQLPHAA